MGLIRKLFLHSPVQYAVACVISTAIVILMLVLRGFDLLIFYVDAFTTAGAVTLLFGLLVLVWYFGAFDSFGYALSTVRAEKRKYRTLYDYAQAKKEKRSIGEFVFMPYITVGTLVLLIGLLIGIGM